MPACSLNFSSPSFREMEFTMHLPWQHLSPASMMWNLEESIMKGTRLISGSDTSRLTKRVIAGTPSIRPSSMLMSRMSAFWFTWRREETRG
jgi:hypothetical protein